MDDEMGWRGGQLERALANGLITLARGAGLAANWLMCIMLALMAALVFIQVVFRYALNQPLAWTEEAARYLMIWVGLLGAALCVQERTHIKFTMLTSRLPSRPRAILVVAADLAIMLFLLGFLVAGIKLLEVASYQRTPAIGMPLVWVYASVPVSATLMLLFLLKDIVTGTRAEPTVGETPPADQTAERSE